MNNMELTFKGTEKELTDKCNDLAIQGACASAFMMGGRECGAFRSHCTDHWRSVIKFEEVKPERWFPEMCETFWFISDGKALPATYSESLSQVWIRALYEYGVIFPTESKAQEAARRIKATLDAYHEELLEGEE